MGGADIMSEVLVYVKDRCPYCAKLISELDSKKVSYRTKNVSEDQSALQEAKNKYKADKVPVMVDGENVTIGHEGKG